MTKDTALYFLMPTDGLPDKLVKMQDLVVKVSWKGHGECHDDIFEKELFIKNKTGMLREISKEEYSYRYAELFPQYVAEEKLNA